MPVYYVDGRFVPADQAMIPVDDLAVLRGIGVFDLLRTSGGRPVYLEEHVARLVESARQIDLDIPWSRETICQVVRETLAKNQLDEASIRIVITGGSSPDFITPTGRPRLLVLVTPLTSPPNWWYTQGIKVITLHAERRIPGAKSIDYLAAALALRQAHAANAVEAIYLDRENHALEGTTSNLFAFIADKLVTPGQGILSGVTRKSVLEIAREHHPVQIRDLPLNELLQAREAFITGTGKGIVPVVQVDETVIGDGRPGRDTRALMTALETLTRGAPVG
jgi:branched-chain amino acid aminotransferase